MKRYVIERPMANAEQMGQRELSLVARHPQQVFKGLDGDIHWLHAYVADDKPFCIFPAKSSALIRRLGRSVGLRQTASMTSAVCSISVVPLFNPACSNRPMRYGNQEV